MSRSCFFPRRNSDCWRERQGLDSWRKWGEGEILRLQLLLRICIWSKYQENNRRSRLAFCCNCKILHHFTFDFVEAIKSNTLIGILFLSKLDVGMYFSTAFLQWFCSFQIEIKFNVDCENTITDRRSLPEFHYNLHLWLDNNTSWNTRQRAFLSTTDNEFSSISQAFLTKMTRKRCKSIISTQFLPDSFHNFTSKLTRLKKLAWQSSRLAPFVWVTGWLMMASYFLNLKI